MRRSVRFRLVAACAALLLATGLAACGDDDDDEATTTEPPTTEAAGEEGDLAAACDAQIELTDGFNAFFGSLPEEPAEGTQPSPEDVAQIQKSYDEHLAPALAEFDEHAPAAIRADVDKGIATFRQFRAQPNPQLLEDPEFEALGKRIDGYLYENCDKGTKQDVSAVDYAFKDLPAEVPAGPLRIKFNNTGKEVHEIVLLTPKPGVTESMDEILALPEEQGQQKADAFFGAFATPGDFGYGIFDLKAGDYVAVCFVPKGTTSEEQRVEGPPHFTLGMRQPVKVT